MIDVCEAVKARTHEMLNCFESNLGTEISTPFSYPDGEAISIVVEIIGGKIYLHDAGLAAMNLSKNGQAFTKKIAKNTESFARMYGCELRGSRVLRQCTESTLTDAMYTVASVCSFIGSHVPFDVQKKAKFEAKVFEILSTKVMDTQNGD